MWALFVLLRYMILTCLKSEEELGINGDPEYLTTIQYSNSLLYS